MSDANDMCDQVEASLADAVDGVLADELGAHVVECDDCRDRIHDAKSVVEEIRGLRGEHTPPVDLEDRILAAISSREDARRTPAIPEIETSAPARELRVIPWSRRSVGAALAIAATVSVGAIALHGRGPHPIETTASAPWRGKVTHVGGPEGGLMLVQGSTQGSTTRALRVGESIAAGAVLRTDARTRARLTFDDGTHLTLDRGGELRLDGKADRAAQLVRGSMVLDATTSDASPMKLAVAGGEVVSPGGKLALSTTSATTTLVSVARGKATTRSNGQESTLGAGDGATLGAKSALLAEKTSGGLAAAFGWSEHVESIPTDDKDVQVPGVGVLRARLPGTSGDGDRALRLVRQSVAVKIAGDIARTEIDETFQSDDAQILEGIFRFPLPPDAQIERLALEVDGTMQEGAFVEKDKGAAIWKGVLFKATPQAPAPRPNEEWIWVPGPWHDPALLEWRAGGRMELRIFPIPAKGARRVVLAYTQRVASVGGARRYVYPLPHFASSIGSGNAAGAIENFSLDVNVVGHDETRGVQLQGYEAEGTGAHRTLHKTGFFPSGDVVVDYARANEGGLATTWGYRAAGSADPAYVALSLSPKLPRVPDSVSRTQVLVLDSSRSMVGERWTRAAKLAVRIVEEMDPRDRFTVLACDVSCVPFALEPQAPSTKAAGAVRTFLEGIAPEGASDPAGSIRAAVATSRDAARALRVIYVGDGAPTIGARSASALETSVRSAIGDGALTAVAVGVDADLASLEAMARGGGGVVLPYVAGQGLGSAALDVLEASYGVALRDPVLTLPSGLESVAPARLPAIRAGSELIVMARMAGSDATGEAKLSGTLAGKPWSTTIPLSVRASGEAGNAFVPRMWATAAIADLERRASPGSVADKSRIVELSKTFAVPSRHTSLLVLESPAMAAAFGVEPRKRTFVWNGDATAMATEIPDAPYKDGVAHAELDDLGYGHAGNGAGKFGGVGTSGNFKAPPMATAGPVPQTTPTTPPMDKPAPESAEKEKKSSSKKMMSKDDDFKGGGGGGGSWVKMRREWYRTVVASAVPTAAGPDADLETKISAARAAAVAAPDSRDKLDALFGLLLRRESLDEAKSVMSTWVARDPLDVPATLRRSELALREGDRVRALRVVTGALEAHPDDIALADGLVDVALRAGDTKLACALSAVHAEVRPNDLEAVARRVSCLRELGEHVDATAALESIDASKRAAVELKISNAPKSKPTTVFGDLTVDATWSSGGDVDLALVDPKGVRLSWLTPSGVKAADTIATGHESLAVPWAGAGTWTVEVTRPSGDGSPVSGTITVRVLGETRAYPFAFAGNRATVARIQIGWASRMVRVFD